MLPIDLFILGKQIPVFMIFFTFMIRPSCLNPLDFNCFPVFAAHHPFLTSDSTLYFPFSLFFIPLCLHSHHSSSICPLLPIPPFNLQDLLSITSALYTSLLSHLSMSSSPPLCKFASMLAIGRCLDGLMLG